MQAEPKSTARVYPQPLGFVSGPAAETLVRKGRALWLCGGPLAFTHIHLRMRGGDGDLACDDILGVDALSDVEGAADAAHGLTETRSLLAELFPERPGRVRIMGILNATPDSFSGDGRADDPEGLIDQGRAFAAAGADLLDIGGESTRPGAAPVDPEEEWTRVAPIFEGLRDRGTLLSIDTRHALVMRRAVDAGARLVNDVSALAHDRDAPATAAALGVPVILMHSSADPAHMHDKTDYDDVALDVFDALRERIEACEQAGIPRRRIIVDPGIGFGKTPEQNYTLIRDVALFHALGCPVMIGLSRKTFLPRIEREKGPARRLAASLAGAQHAVCSGVHFIRVHDVEQTLAARETWEKLQACPNSSNFVR